MGTRAVIRVEGIDFAQVYKHWDGYPSATLPWLKHFNQAFTKERGDDPHYKFAQLLRSSAFDGEQFELDKSRATGWGVMPYGEDSWQEFIYVLLKGGAVAVQGADGTPYAEETNDETC